VIKPAQTNIDPAALDTSGAALPFSDILDGYFTLKESVRQMMARHDFTWVWLTLLHAPIMDIEGLAPDEPVPLHLREHYAGLIDCMTLTALCADPANGNGPMLIGAGDWQWLDTRPDTALPADIRLGEPAYFSGFGYSATTAANGKPPTAQKLIADTTSALPDATRLRPFYC
jgi:hypothetical protein